MSGNIRNCAVAGAEMFIDVSNYYWSVTPVEGMQHGVNGLFQAVENRLPRVRATTSGLTMGGDPKGRILKRLGFFEEGALVVDLPLLLLGLGVLAGYFVTGIRSSWRG